MSSETSVSSFNMSSAIISGMNVPGQTEILYTPEARGWSDGHTYSWTVRHQPSLNSLSVSVMEDDQPLWSHQWDKNFAQPQHIGQVGVYTHSQPARFFNMTVQPLCIV